MTTITFPHPATPSSTQVTIDYQVSMPQPETHLFEVLLKVSGWQAHVLDLKMPVWTPGSYLVREYARHVQDFAVLGRDPLGWHKVSKNHWRVTVAGLTEMTIRYRVFANELTVRTNHLDATHGYLNPAALFFYVVGWEQHPIRIRINPPSSEWQVATALPALADDPLTFVAPDFDTLVDSPFEIGLHQRYTFEAAGKPHEFVVWGRGNLDAQQMIRDTQRIIDVEADLFGGLPYESYLFILHLTAQGFGGLEHKNSCSLIYSRFGFQSPEKYQRYLQLVAHEFFHLWNVKRIRPKALEKFDYEAENYTPSLWFSEGTTSYYDVTIPFRAGLYEAKTFLSALSKEISRFLTIPGRHVQPLSESSFDAWIKLYRRDANSDNNQISYYLKGEMVSLLIDLLIRQRHHNGRSLDDVMRLMWQQFGIDEIGFTPMELERAIQSVAEMDLTDFFHRCLHTTDELPFNEYLQPFGLRLVPDLPQNCPPFVGLTVQSEGGRERIRFVEMGSPAQQAGLDIGDELLAINGLRVTAEQWSDRLNDFAPGDTIQVTVFHTDELQTCAVTLEEPRPKAYRITPVEHPTAAQRELLQGWLGCTPDDLMD